MNRTLKGVIICSALSLFAALVIKAEIANTAFQKNKRASSSQRTKRIDELFKRNCARCHGADGRSDTPLGHLYNAPDFTDPEWWEKKNPSKRKLLTIVARGKGAMPAFGKKLTRAEINLLVGRMQSFKKVN